MIIIPIAICYGIDAMTDENTTGVTAYKIVGSALGIVLVLKMVQMLGSVFLRKPIRHGYFWWFLAKNMIYVIEFIHISYIWLFKSGMSSIDDSAISSIKPTKTK